MKKIFTLFMAVWALLSISQTVKAVDFCIMGTFTGEDRAYWAKLDGKNMDLVGTNKYSQTYQCTKAGEYRFRFIGIGWNGEMCPDQSSYDLTQASPSYEVAYTDQKDKNNNSYKDNYFYVNMESGKTYTFTFDDSDKDKRSVACTVSGSPEVTTKVIKLLDGTSEVTGSNGKYTLDLSSATSDAAITLTIDGTNYGLATAQTIAAAGTTLGIAFTTEGTAALTLKAGLIYSLTVTEDGKMTVVAEEKVVPYSIAGAGFYLVGDFMSQYNDKTVNPGGDTPGKINYERLYFKFEEQADGSYRIVIPACLTAKMQILGISVDGVPQVYGPANIVNLHGAKGYGTASPVTNGSVGGNDTDKLEIVEGFNDSNNYWNLVTRNDNVTDDDGSYVVSFKFDEKTLSPTTWTIQHDGRTRVTYLLSTAKEATAQPLYDTLDEHGHYSNKHFAAIHLDGLNRYFVLGTVVSNLSTDEIKVQAEKANDGIHIIPDGNGCGTHNKLFFLGAEPKYNSDNSIIVQSSNKLYGNQPAVVLSNMKGNKIVEVNPNKGDNEDAKKDKSYGLQADIYIPNMYVIDYPDVISMVGPAIPSTTTIDGGNTKWLWDATAGNMTYDESDRCYKLVLNTSDELKNKTFRFVGDHEITKNWYEDDIKANGDYPTSKEGFSDATVADPNKVLYTSDCTEDKIDHNQDIIWNRPAGLWTVRFYINDDKTFHYTITGAHKIYIPVIAHMGKLLRTYTSAVDVVPVNDDVLIFAAHSYTKKGENNTGSGDETGTVKLYRLKFIPANQGVVLYAPNTTLPDNVATKLEVVPAYSATVKRYSQDAFDYVEDWAKSEAKESIWVNAHPLDKWNNYLMPVLADTKVTQFYYDENNEWTGRIFSFTRYSKTKTGKKNNVKEDDVTNADASKRDYFSFFRANGTVKASYSYLMLPRTAMEGNGQILDQNQDNDKETKLFAKSMAWFEGIDAPMDNETTGISELKNHASNSDAAYYTLQGVKVVKPVKGIYIHQGKKVIVK